MANIFLSYRRTDAGGWAGRLSDSLRTALPGTAVFMDVDAIPPGVKFANYIADAVGQCEVLLVMIGPHWANDENLQRLHGPKDFVRMEIATALQRGIRVIPTRVGEAPLPSAAALPEQLRELLDLNDFVISDRSWDDDCRRLAAALRPVLETKLPTPPQREADAVARHKSRTDNGSTKSKWAIVFALMSLVAGALGLSGLAGGASSVALLLCLLFFVLAAVFAVMARLGAGAARKSLE